MEVVISRPVEGCVVSGRGTLGEWTESFAGCSIVQSPLLGRNADPPERTDPGDASSASSTRQLIKHCS